MWSLHMVVAFFLALCLELLLPAADEGSALRTAENQKIQIMRLHRRGLFQFATKGPRSRGQIVATKPP